MLLKYQAKIPLFSQATPPLHVLFEDDQGYLVNGRFTGPHTLYEERVDASGWPWTYSTPHDLSAWSQSDVSTRLSAAPYGVTPAPITVP